MSVDLSVSDRLGVVTSNLPVQSHQGFRIMRSVSSIAWKAFATVGLLMTGIPKTEACCTGLHKFKMLTLYPTVERLFPALKKPNLPLDTLMDELGLICPVPDFSPNLNELEEQAVRIDLALFRCFDPQDYGNRRIPDMIREFEKLGIKDPSSVIKIYETCLRNDKWYLRSILKRIQDCEVTNEDDRIRLAEIALESDGWWGDSLGFYHDFCIFTSATEDQTALVKFVDEAIKTSAARVARHFKQFNIIDPAVRLRMAKLCAQNAGMVTAREIANFDIREPWAILEVAELCFRHDFRAIRHCENFNIQDMTVAQKFIDLCFHSNQNEAEVAYAVAANIHKLPIQNQEFLIKVADRCMMANPKATAYYIENFNIENELTKANILTLCDQKVRLYQSPHFQMP